VSTRTRVGIVEWARRTELARVTEMWLADTLGTRVAEAADAAAKVDLVRRARLHAWHAELWKSVAPVLHNSSVDAVTAPGLRAGTNPASVLERLDDDYGAWRAEASPVAEAPIIRVLRLVVRDHEDEAAG
jgi:hypothetical protein